MERIISNILAFLVSVFMAAMAALTLGYIAHYDFGISRQDIRTQALVGAGTVALLLATEFFGKMLRRSK
jgi:hypothetical protein